MKKYHHLNLRTIAAWGLAVLCIGSCLTGCGDKKANTLNSEHIVSNFTNICNNGELYTDTEGRLNFCDFESMKSSVLCPNPNCTHSSPDTCSSFGMSNHPIIFDSSLYFFDTEIIQEDKDFKYHSKVYKANADGTNRSVIAEVDDLNIPEYARMLVYNDIAYFPAEKVEFDEYGATTGYTTTYLYALDLSSGKLTNRAEICSGYHGGAWVYGSFDNKVYLNCSASEEQLDYTDIEALQSIEHQYLCYDIAEEKLIQSELPIPTLVQNGNYIYVSDNSMIVKREGQTDKPIENFTYNEINLVNNKLFSAWNGVVADIDSGKVYQLKETDWETVAFVNNKYILKKGDDIGNQYKEVGEDELIGDECT